VNSQRRQPSPYAAAIQWVAKITTVALEMMLPAVGGGYLDRRLGTSYWTLIGLVLGMTVGLMHLLQMTKFKAADKHRASGKNKDTSSGSAGD
jgi:F0F1-type ATP synthase assembly protein I